MKEPDRRDLLDTLQIDYEMTWGQIDRLAIKIEGEIERGV